MTDINVAMMPTDWWAWDGDNLHPLGVHDSIDEAYEVDDARPGVSSTWIFSREALTALRDQINEELK